MKSERHFLSRSAHGFKRPFAGNENRAFVKSKCPACGQIVKTITDPSPERDKAVIAFPTPVSGKLDRKHPSNATDLEKVLHFSQQLYAHALTLQELLRNEGEVTYEVLRPRYDRQAAQQFEIFYHALELPSGFRKPAGSCK
jgi:hypothetical protein